MSWLTEASKAINKPKTGIIQVLKNRMAGYEPARDHLEIHASDVTKDEFCPRAWAFMVMAKDVPKGSYVSTALRATYDLGHATAKTLIEQWGADCVVGNWECLSCKSVRTMCKRPTNGCTHFDRTCQWEYREVRFEAPDYGISGRLDVLFDLNVPKLAVTELKTYAADEFDKMLAPLPEHRTRTQLYLKIIANSGSVFAERINLHEARVFYVSRGFGRMNKDHNEILPFREFVVPRDDSSPDVQLALNKGKQIKVYRETGKMPAGICNTPTDKQAKGCLYCKQCWSGDHPQQQGSL